MTDAPNFASVCTWFRHDFGLLPRLDREAMIREAQEWLRALEKEGMVVRADTVQAMIAEAVAKERAMCIEELYSHAEWCRRPINVEHYSTAANCLEASARNIRNRKDTK